MKNYLKIILFSYSISIFSMDGTSDRVQDAMAQEDNGFVTIDKNEIEIDIDGKSSEKQQLLVKSESQLKNAAKLKIIKNCCKKNQLIVCSTILATAWCVSLIILKAYCCK